MRTLATTLEAIAPGPIVTLRCVSGNPVYLVKNAALAPSDAMYNWTNTNLPLLEVGEPITDATKDKCVALLYGLEAHGLGLPLAAYLETPHAEAIETCALVRGHDRFLQDGHLNDFLPVVPSQINNLLVAINTSSPMLRIATGHRLAAVMIEANVFPMLRAQFGAILHRCFSGLEAVTSIIRAADPTIATNEIMRWIDVATPRYAYRRDRGASAKKPRVHPLDRAFDAVLSSTRLNRKNFRLEFEYLQKHMHAQWMRPYVGVNHDRTKPPIAIVLGTHISRNEHEGIEEFELHGRIAGLHERGTKSLMQGGGLSIAFHERVQ